MIYINSQIEAGKVYQSESEIYPRLYVTDGSVQRRLKRLAVEIENGDIYPMDEKFEYEIIGNIYDNPELLRSDTE